MLGISLLANFLIATTVALVTFIYWIFRRQDYFKNHNIPYVKSLPLLGTFSQPLLGKASYYDNVIDVYNQPEVKGKPFFGAFLFHKPILMVNEPEIIKKILVKDFHSFGDRYSTTDTHDSLGYHQLFSLKNPLWKTMRGKLSPFFSSGKMKTMYYILDKISVDLVDHIDKKLNNQDKVELELKELAALFATDVIASCAYGVDARSLENPDGEFRTIGKGIFELTPYRSIEFTSVFVLPQVTKLFGFQTFTKKGTKFIKETITHVMNERKNGGKKRNDLIDTLIGLQEGEDPIDIDITIAQAAFFFTAGYETSSATISFALYEIAKNKDMLDRVRNDIRDLLKKNDGKVTYDSIMNSPEIAYLDQIINETLRLYPIIPILDRICTKPDGYSLAPYSDYKIPYQMPIQIPVYPIQLDEKNFPEPLKFDPERFSPENIHNVKPFTFFPFGSGPRNCIGERFALMQVKIGIVKILKEFRLEPSSQTPLEIVLHKKTFVIQSDKGLYMNFIRDPIN